MQMRNTNNKELPFVPDLPEYVLIRDEQAAWP